MIKIENFQVVGWEHAIRGMRNPKNSWALSDSSFKGTATTHELDSETGDINEIFVEFDALAIGHDDYNLAMKLAGAGPVHGKFRRMITVYVDITAPLYWWKEFDTYKVGTVANSCSTMHKIHAKEFELEDFSTDRIFETSNGWIKSPNGTLYVSPLTFFESIVIQLNVYREKFLETNDKVWWEQMIQLLPSSYNQKRTVMLNYEVLANIYQYRRNHKLDEWVELCKWIETLTYSEIITGETQNA